MKVRTSIGLINSIDIRQIFTGKKWLAVANVLIDVTGTNNFS